MVHKRKYGTKTDRAAVRMLKRGKLTDTQIIKRTGIDRDVLEISKDILKDDPTYFNCK